MKGILIALFTLAAPASASGDREFGQHLAGECVTCHLLSGKPVGAIPPITGYPEDQFIAVMESYRKKDRDNQVMQVIAGKLKDDEIAALAAFFASLPKPQ